MKRIEELEFKDDFMFSTVMKNEEICKALLEEILGVKIKKIKYIEREKTIDNNFLSHGVRLDVFLVDNKNTVYNIEMQITFFKNLGKRSRYNQCAIDMALLNRGMDYSELNKSYIIFICNFDPFGKGLYKYTFETRCKEDLPLILDDEAVKIYLNTEGYQGEASDNLKKVLSYLHDPNVELDCDLTKKIQEEVEKVRIDPVEKGRFKMIELKFADKYKEGKADGESIGEANGKADIVNTLLQQNSIAQVAAMLGKTEEEIKEIVKM